MTQEENQLLLIDLCRRLPYGIKCEIDDLDEPLELESIKFKGDYFIFGNGVYERYITEIKPYLRPMSSMTEEEFTELKNYTELKYDQLELVDWNNAHRTIEFYLEEIPHYCVIKVFDWLDAHHFDYRGLIEKGLAIEATDGMYNSNEK